MEGGGGGVGLGGSCEKKVCTFYIAKATHIFCSKNINVFENTSAARVNEFVINDIVKLAML